MNVVYWRMMNGGMGYMNGSTPTAALTTLPPASPAPITLPPSYYPASYLSPAPAQPAVPSPASSSLLPKYYGLPEWSMHQLQYMFLPKLPRLKGEKINKSVKCDVCNITLNSEVQAKQHYNGKNHLKKMKQIGMNLPGEEDGKKIMENSSNKSQDGDSEAQSSTTSETPATDDNGNETVTSLPASPDIRNDSNDVTIDSGDSDTTDSTQACDNLVTKLPRKRRLEIPCPTCDIVFSSQVQAEQHFKGIPHAKRTRMAQEDQAEHSDHVTGQVAEQSGSRNVESCDSKQSINSMQIPEGACDDSLDSSFSQEGAAL